MKKKWIKTFKRWTADEGMDNFRNTALGVYEFYSILELEHYGVLYRGRGLGQRYVSVNYY